MNLTQYIPPLNTQENVYLILPSQKGIDLFTAINLKDQFNMRHIAHKAIFPANKMASLQLFRQRYTEIAKTFFSDSATYPHRYLVTKRRMYSNSWMLLEQIYIM